MNSDVRWVLAFDSACCTCRDLAEVVGEATGPASLEVLPLDHEDVARWRGRAFHNAAPWKPTLLRVDQESVRGWAGATMPLRLVRHLGVTQTIRVVKALGTARAAHDQTRRETASTATREGMPRKRFLRLATGLGVAGGIVLSGNVPALASQKKTELAEAKQWVEANRSNLPTSYDAVVGHSAAYRRAIFNASTPQTKSSLWLEQVRRYRSRHATASAERNALLRQASELLGDPATYEQQIDLDGELHRRLDALREAFVDEYGKPEARRILAHLGPEDATTAAGCTCNDASDWCSGNCWVCCDFTVCNDGCTGACCCEFIDDGCGTGWIYQCHGLCYD